MMPKPTLFATLRCVLLGALAVFVATQFVCIADGESISNETGVVRIPIAALDTGKGNFFDSQSFDPAVLVNPEDSSQLIMFFSAMAAPVARGEMRIGRATANVSDPTVWTVSNGGKPVLQADEKSWDQEGQGLRCDSVLYNTADRKLYLYYSPGTHIGLATSSDLRLTSSTTGPWA